MDEAALHELLSGRRRDVGARLLRSGLHVASWGYTNAMRLRNLAYDRGWLSVERVDAPVISLGNITTGGTGKTPMAAWLANWLVKEGRTPGLLSRGYRSLDEAAPLAERDGDIGNDEKLVLDRLCPHVPHLQQRDRVGSARRAVSKFGCDVLILDDGFQHRRLHRDLDLVLIDALQPWGFGHVLPRGLLREPLSGLRRADLILLTRADQAPAEQLRAVRCELLRWRRTDECVEVAFVPQRLIGLHGETLPSEAMRSQKAFAFCGIGNPQGFRQTVASFGAAGDVKAFPDHHHYTTGDLITLAGAAQRDSADVVLTTLKDLVKIPPNGWTGPPLFAVEVGVEFLSGANTLVDCLQHLKPFIRHAA